jgi:aspartyl/glutamyl-tRNA(Asn/Gln) amidotransferase C subunit
MTEEITPEVFNRLVSLAALELDLAEAEYLHGQLNNQLRAVHELEAIPLTEDVPPARHGVPFPAEISPALRTDELKPFSYPDEIIDQGPFTTDRYFVVPETPHTRLE